MPYCLKLLTIAAVTLPAAMVTILVGLFDPHGKRVYRIGRFWTWLILTVGGVSVKIDGPRPDPTRQFVFMVNHQSNIDIPVLIQSLPSFQLRWIAKRELVWVPLFGWAMWASKHITVKRSDRADALDSLRRARKRMESGISVVVFPEGTRSTDGKLLPFKRGGFLLAVKAQTPILPVTISGSGLILPKGDWRIRHGEVRVTFGRPIAVDSYRSGTLRALKAEAEESIRNNLRLPADMTGHSSCRPEPLSFTKTSTV